MAYTDDSVRAKLSALNETQEGIVTVAQWVMFHRRHADRTAQLWLQKLRDSPAPKRLNLIYLANEVAQQSRVRRKEDFLIAFSPIIAEAVATAYRGSSNDIQQKIRRVVEVWRQRSIFELPIQEAVEARVDEIDKSRSTGKKPLLGGSLFSSSSGSTPTELQPLVPLQVALSKATVASGTSATAANAEYDRMNDPSMPLPTPPVHAARLSQLLKTLANAESSVSEVVKSRLALIDGLEKLLETNRIALSKEEALALQLQDKKAETESKKRDVEDAIMRGLSTENLPATSLDFGQSTEGVARPEVEALTPPPVEAITPVGSPKQEAQGVPAGHEQGAGTLEGFSLGFDYSGDASIPGLTQPSAATAFNEMPQDILNGLHSKKRKVTHGEEDYAQFASGDLDADVAELLNQEGNLQS
ncbi:RNA polymerase II-binding domain-containing protein [Aspergillus heterothallicus]